VTSLAVLAISGAKGYEEIADRGVKWLVGHAGMATSIWTRLARLAMGTNTSATDHIGWPWFPGAASWVIPTSLAICALARHRKGPNGHEIAIRLEEARRFLLSRQCPDHGWNHGGLFQAGEVPLSYPETTGIALLAIAATGGAAAIDASLQCAERHAANPLSSEGAVWLRLGLMAHGRSVEVDAGRYRDWTVNQMALRMIADSGPAGFVGHA
jgi:hypothetical protein